MQKMERRYDAEIAMLRAKHVTGQGKLSAQQSVSLNHASI